MKKDYTLTMSNDKISVTITDGINNKYQNRIKIEVDLLYPTFYESDSLLFKNFSKFQPVKIKEVSYCVKRFANDTLANWTHEPTHYISEESLNAGLNQVNKNLAQYNKTIKNACKHPAYKAMVEIVLNNVQHYHTDFKFYDCHNLGQDFEKPFIWLVRDCGTWFLNNSTSTNLGILEYCIKNDNPKIYYYTGRVLVEIGKDEVNNFISKLPKE